MSATSTDPSATSACGTSDFAMSQTNACARLASYSACVRTSSTALAEKSNARTNNLGRAFSSGNTDDPVPQPTSSRVRPSPLAEPPSPFGPRTSSNSRCR
eukprot:Amastigsp_a4286_82.p5 type:complete len:100 gc:universal Amastigsp_a4286_82:352-651(+)